MAVSSIWFNWQHADTSGNSGSISSGVTISFPPTSNTLLATATLSQTFINSSGGSASAQVDSIHLVGFPQPVQVNLPAVWMGYVGDRVFDAPIEGYTFSVTAYAQSAGFGFSNGSNANGMFIVYGWDG
jgi:hypothetical protein